MALTTEAAHTAAARVLEVDSGRPLGELGIVRSLLVSDGGAAVTLALPTPKFPGKERIEAAVRDELTTAGASRVDVTWTGEMPTRTILPDDACPDVKNVVLVMSGKGGVGKSTVATNLALALARDGCQVGLLDADMYGPSIPTMLGVSGQPGSLDGKRFLPLERFGVRLMSLGFLVDPKQAVVWRGPMLQNALLQFLRDVEWGALDYLLLDLPPGTGDIALTISQKLRTTGAVIVTTPQEVALQDVYKSVDMAKKVGIPLLGVVENESYFVCDGCSKRHELFGAGGGQKVAEFAEAPLLGQIPIDPAVREWGDAGTPVTQAAPDSAIAKSFVGVARRLAGCVVAHDLATGGALRIDRTGGTQKHLPIAR